MNSKFLYAATLVVALVSTLAMADEAPVTRARVTADLQRAIADGTLQRTDYGYGSYRQNQATASAATRAQVGIELDQAKAARQTLIGPDANRNYNPYGTQIHAVSTRARAQVKNDVRQAAANGTLHRTDYDDAALIARQVNAQAASATFAQRFKAKFSKDHG